MAEPAAIISAIQRLRPMCPSCGREAKLPRIEGPNGRGKFFDEMTDCERTRQHAIACLCGIAYAARFYEGQK